MDQIKLLVKDQNLEESTALSLENAFTPFLLQAEERKTKALAIKVTDIAQKEEMKNAKTMRLQLRQVRVSADKLREELKEESIKKGKAIQSVYNFIENIIKPLEAHLEEQEKFAEVQEAKRKADLKAKRLEILAPYEITPERIAMVQLDEMTDEQFELFRSESEALQKFRKSEEERKANEEKEREAENQRIREDNARLQAEAKAKDEALAKANAEKKAQEDKERQEAIDKEKLQQDIAYKAFLAVYGCTPETKEQFTTKKLDNGTIVLYKKVAEYNPVSVAPANFDCLF